MKRTVKRTAKGAARRTARRTARVKRKSAANLTRLRTKSGAAKKAAAKKPAPRDAIDVLVEAGAQALDLPFDPAWHAGIKFNLQLILRHAALVDEFPMPDDAEPAPVYHA
ncbi:MAG TPA: DUF4089 domain-containing protein [Xanthobacteraceae bacterium]|nr:DUF4089 domain-containing protein [Xanthobacteraceae bacterium]